MWKKIKLDTTQTKALNHVEYEINVSDMNHNLKHVKGSSFFIQLSFVVGPSTTNQIFGSMICTINNHQAVALTVEQHLPLEDQGFFFSSWQHTFELQIFWRFQHQIFPSHHFNKSFLVDASITTCWVPLAPHDFWLNHHHIQFRSLSTIVGVWWTPTWPASSQDVLCHWGDSISSSFPFNSFVLEAVLDGDLDY